MNNAEIKINKLLQDTLMCYLSLKKQKRYELATAVLRFGSEMADLALNSSGIRNTYYKPKCHHCGRLTVSQADRWSWQSTGLCLGCDHVESDGVV